jgi:hypothetical protein
MKAAFRRCLWRDKVLIGIMLDTTAETMTMSGVEPASVTTFDHIWPLLILGYAVLNRID